MNARALANASGVPGSPPVQALQKETNLHSSEMPLATQLCDTLAITLP
jgi:hypothetical protein